MTGTIQDLIEENIQLKAKWENLRLTLLKERDTFERKPGHAAGIWESGYGRGIANAIMFMDGIPLER